MRTPESCEKIIWNILLSICRAITEHETSYFIHEKKIKTCSGLNGGPSTQKYLCPNPQLSDLEKGFLQMQLNYGS